MFVRRITTTSKETKRGQLLSLNLVKDFFSEEECVLVLEDEEQQEPAAVCDVRRLEEYHAEDFSLRLPITTELGEIDSLCETSKRQDTSVKQIKRQSTPSTSMVNHDIKDAAADADADASNTSLTDFNSAWESRSTKQTIRKLFNRIVSKLPSKKRANKISCVSRIEALSFSDTETGGSVIEHSVAEIQPAVNNTIQATDAELQLSCVVDEPSYLTSLSRNAEESIGGRWSLMPSRRSRHNDYMLVSRPSEANP